MKHPASYSPSRVHHAAMKDLVPELHYDGSDIASWQRKLRRRLIRLLGDQPAERAPLRPRRLWRREHPLGIIEKVVFTGERHADVPAYVCLPASARPPYPFMIALQGHSTGMHNSIGVQFEDETQPKAIEGDRDFGIGCMRRGIAALCIEQRAFGERGEQLQQARASHPCHDAAMHSLMLGRTLIGERVYDVDRAIDYLAARGDADVARLGVMGNSGGGTISLFAAAVLPRIRFAMPSCYFCTFKASIMSIYHCSDNYVPGLLKVAEMSDILGLFAPRPVVVVAGRDDPIFPIKGVRQGFRDLRRIYAACGAERHCHLVVGNGGHRFYADDAWPVMLNEIKAASGRAVR
jgi:dienelactone hydrolase